MSVEFGAGRAAGLGKLRTGAALALVLAAASLAPAMAQSAPEPCHTCGFLVRVSGSLSELFGVCANGNANDDGRVVSFDHGCGAHSEVSLQKRHLPKALPEHVLDDWDDELVSL